MFEIFSPSSVKVFSIFPALNKNERLNSALDHISLHKNVVERIVQGHVNIFDRVKVIDIRAKLHV